MQRISIAVTVAGCMMSHSTAMIPCGIYNNFDLHSPRDVPQWRAGRCYAQTRVVVWLNIVSRNIEVADRVLQNNVAVAISRVLHEA